MSKKKVTLTKADAAPGPQVLPDLRGPVVPGPPITVETIRQHFGDEVVKELFTPRTCHCCGHPVKPGEVCPVDGNVTP